MVLVNKMHQSDHYAKNLTKLEEFKNQHIDFRIYFCAGVFFKNKEKHEPAYSRIKMTFASESEGHDPLIVSQKFMLSSIYNCLKVTQKYESLKFYLKIREFASPGKKVIFLLTKRLANRI